LNLKLIKDLNACKGRIVVRKLLIEGYRVRVLVRDLYSSTLNLLGTKVIYCKGDLYSYDSLEFAVTDVDKIVYCAADEVDEKSKHNIDSTGLTNLVQSFLNTRVADYGMSQSAKRTLFKFGRDFNLFDLESSEEKSTAMPLAQSSSSDYEGLGKDSGLHDIDSDEYVDDYADVYEKVDPDVNISLEGNTLSASWILNNNNRAVFHGRIPTFDRRYRTMVISEKLQSRNKDFLDFRQAGFAGLILRVVGDGKVYEAIIRTSDGTEYSSPFRTATKPQKNAALAAASGASRIPKFVTIRLPFSSFKNEGSDKSETNMFDGSCVQYFGIRFRTSLNPNLQKSYQPKKFYLALAYVKLYRRPFLKGPEFIYFSDASIPPLVSPDMVRHDVNQIIALSGDDPSLSSEYELFNEKKEKQTESSSIERGRRLGNTETYFKYIGEQALKSSGLNYAIFRVSGYNNAPGSDGASMIELSQEDNEEKYSSKDDERLQLVSRADVAELCVSSLSSPSACNVFCYVRNRTRRKYRKSGAPKNIPLNEKISKLKADI